MQAPPLGERRLGARVRACPLIDTERPLLGYVYQLTLTFMDQDYFRDFTPENLKLYADYLRYQLNETEDLSDEEMARNYSGDDYIKVVYETEYDLVVLSVDSGIEVINCIKKADFSKSQSVEL